MIPLDVMVFGFRLYPERMISSLIKPSTMIQRLFPADSSRIFSKANSGDSFKPFKAVFPVPDIVWVVESYAVIRVTFTRKFAA
ncbi:hypothetical protein D3C80_1545160 [compost metagenome]